MTSATATVEKELQATFEDFENIDIYERSLARTFDPRTRNFVVEFGKDEAQIAFDLLPDDIEALLKVDRVIERPVRWINIWAPDRQINIVNLIGKHYQLSARLLAAIVSTPPAGERTHRKEKPIGRRKAKIYQGNDLEEAMAGGSLSKSEYFLSKQNVLSDNGHYAIAQQMKHYHSVDHGSKFLCIGANWSHPVSADEDEAEIISEGKQRAVWSWLILCEDHTVISLHEDLGPLKKREYIKSLRSNTLSVLTQLSNYGHGIADSISMQSVRQALGSNLVSDLGSEGASNLFYYLFDDWRAVYLTVSDLHRRLEGIQTAIIGDVTRKSGRRATVAVIPRLHRLGRQLKQMERLYQGYKKLISRILALNAAKDHDETKPSGSENLIARHYGVKLAQSAAMRFERMGDRIDLLILPELSQEFLDEKDALISTYYNMTAQRDAEATTRLAHAATLLAKLSVLFLPISLMTAYFSIQIKDLEGVYIPKDYWYSFATIVSISVVGIFVFPKALSWGTRVVDRKVLLLGQRRREREREREWDDYEGEE